MTTTEYSRWCGPIALSAVLDATPTRSRPLPITCAGLLLAIQRQTGEHSAPGTPADHMAIAVLHYGLGIERWDARTGAVIETGAELLQRVRTERRDPAPVRHVAMDLIASAPGPERPVLLETWRARHRDRPTLRDWLSRTGRWLIAVDGDESAHWLTLRDHRIVAGDDKHASTYGAWPIVELMRVTT